MALAVVAGVVREWIRGRVKRSVVLTINGDSIEMTAPSSTMQERALEAFINQAVTEEKPSQDPSIEGNSAAPELRRG